ncbi:MAG: zinc-dependent peptidase [Planctomycetia bacterium]|nr:zinc-dependent peptidase [Planctomycetia bacterium]
MFERFGVLACIYLAAQSGVGSAADGVLPAPKTVARQVQDVEGWKVHVDRQLLDGPHAELGTQALRVLAFKLYEVKQLVAPDRVEKLQRVPIFLDLSDPRLKAMQYHPSVGWLKANGHDPALARVVHLPQAADLVSRLPLNRQPMVILHELAHGYHDQVLGFDDQRIQEAWARFKDSGKYEQALHITGKQIRHYGLMNHKEFFAEMTEAYFGTNDFYPFVRAELRKELPDVYKLLEEIWGAVR